MHVRTVLHVFMCVGTGSVILNISYLSFLLLEVLHVCNC